MLMPPVSRYMTLRPSSIEPSDRLSSARQLMRSNDIHHLPVVEGGTLVGILSDRDIYPIYPFHDPAVADVMTDRVATAPNDTPIDEVIDLMGAKRCGSIVILGNGGVEGIFTVTDALRALSDVLRRNVDEPA